MQASYILAAFERAGHQAHLERMRLNTGKWEMQVVGVITGGIVIVTVIARLVREKNPVRTGSQVKWSRTLVDSVEDVRWQQRTVYGVNEAQPVIWS